METTKLLPAARFLSALRRSGSRFGLSAARAFSVNHHSLERIDRALELGVAEISEIRLIRCPHCLLPALEQEQSLLLSRECGHNIRGDALLMNDLLARGEVFRRGQP